MTFHQQSMNETFTEKSKPFVISHPLHWKQQYSVAKSHHRGRQSTTKKRKGNGLAPCSRCSRLGVWRWRLTGQLLLPSQVQLDQVVIGQDVLLLQLRH